MRHVRGVWLGVIVAAACGDDVVDGSGGTTAALTMVDPTNVGTTSATTGPSTGPDEPTGGTTGGVTTTNNSTGTSTTEQGSTTGGDETTTTPVDPSTDTSSETGSSTAPASSSSGEPACPEDQVLCAGDTAQVCDGLGGFKSEEACPGACAPDKGCVACLQGEVICQGGDVYVCDDEDVGPTLQATCDPLQGLACDEQVGTCSGPCASLGLSHIGCDYYPTVLQAGEMFTTAPKDVFAVAVANTTGTPAQVTVTRAGAMVAQVMVAAGAVQVVTLPWVDLLCKTHGPSVLVKDGAYRLRSTQPVTVYQYNPLEATDTNDASVLLPVNAWTGDYVVASWPMWQAPQMTNFPGFYAVVARQDDTKVTLTPSTSGKVVQAGGGVAADGAGQVILGEGDVLQVLSGNSDLTGTLVHADKPVQVFGGHECTQVPFNVQACDHLEESMYPIETLAKEYVVAPPSQTDVALDKGQVVRVIASEAATTLTFTPDQQVAKVLAKAGDFVELPQSTSKYVVTADKKIMVVQYMVGQNGGYGSSDPSMLLAINPKQWRSSYLFYAATTWTNNAVDLVSTKDAVVTVDGAPVAGWKPIGATNYQYTHVALNNAGDGTHRVVSDVGVGIAVNGIKNSGSYWYPGGLDLNVIPQ